MSIDISPSRSAAPHIDDQFLTRSFDVAVVGLGYVGLPLAHGACTSGLTVAGFDIDTGLVDGLRAGRSHVDDLSDTDVSAMNAGGFHATSRPQVLRDADVVVICVPTPLSRGGGPDLGAVRSAVVTVGSQLTRDTLVILESTTYPGTTEEIVAPILEECSGLKAGRDFFLAFSPERVDPGNPTFGIRNTPKIVGGLTPECGRRAAAFYSRFVDQVVPVRGTREAETAKLLENTYRQVNIALVNELARACHELGIDIWDVIDAAATKPFGFQAFRPGVGVGGHCIPIDPVYLSHHVREKLGYPLRFVELAQEINNSMPAYVAARAQELLNQHGTAVRGARIVLLGVTYKPNIADDRESPAAPLARLLRDKGAQVSFHDPYVDDWGVPGVTRVDDAELCDAVGIADLVILVQNHAAYDLARLSACAGVVLDTKGTATGDNVHRL